MKRFVQLYDELDATTATGDKVAALVRYFQQAPPDDAVWALALLTGRRIKRAVTSAQLRLWAQEASGYPAWLIDESYAAVGDLSETLSLILPEGVMDHSITLKDLIRGRITAMARASETDRKAILLGTWSQLDRRALYVFHKLISGTFRVGVSRLLAVRALAQVAGVPQEEMDHRLMGDWEPTPDFYAAILRSINLDGSTADQPVHWNPYPFFLAHQLQDTAFLAEALGSVHNWQAEWKWDGIRGQIIKRAGRVALWSRGEELLTERFSDLIDAAERLPDGTVLDGEVLAWENGRPLPFAQLQTRINKRQPTGLLFADVPVVFNAYDLLEHRGVDTRQQPLSQRRLSLEQAVTSTAHPLLQLSPRIAAQSWEHLAQIRADARSRGVEGLMLKHLDSPYGVGRTRITLVDAPTKAGWWKWKIDPYLVDCVLVAAQRGSGRRASLFTDYTFAVWTGPDHGQGELVHIAKAYSGLTDNEILEVDAFVRANTTGRVAGAGIRTVAPRLVFEIAFEGIARSPRHKSGIATRFPRINRWRKDKPPQQADTLPFVLGLLAKHTETQLGPGGIERE